ncbi:MAG: hypothetical protein PHY47_01100 [Lachnospiraceae bacterium]|nr:hypothetical protein [Lachnospiraceae bacterium]
MSYIMFRSTRAIAKAGIDGLGELAGDKKLSRCPRCGNFQIEAEICSRCNGKMHKMYRDYHQQSKLVDDSLMMGEDL